MTAKFRFSVGLVKILITEHNYENLIHIHCRLPDWTWGYRPAFWDEQTSCKFYYHKLFISQTWQLHSTADVISIPRRGVIEDSQSSRLRSGTSGISLSLGCMKRGHAEHTTGRGGWLSSNTESTNTRSVSVLPLTSVKSCSVYTK